MGGYLQEILNGYGGIRVRRDGLYFNPVLPKNSSSINITGEEFVC